MDNIDWNIECESCFASSGSDIFIDTNIGELVCKKCGVVQTKYIWVANNVYEVFSS